MSDATHLYDNFRIVLIEPRESRNVGAAARAMCNLGFRHLRLVAPRGYDPEQAAVTARNARPILDSLTIHERFDEAIGDAQEVVGLALRKGRNPAHFVALPQWAQALPDRAGAVTALVFGPEDDDLRDEHLEACRWVVRIPSSSAFPSFNLAQSVLLVLYEIARTVPAESAPLVDAPTAGDFQTLDRLLDTVMARSGFVRPGSPEPVPALVRSLFRRPALTRHELSVLTALFGRLDTALRRGSNPDA